ncbi:hypothetical protein SAMN05878494_1815 [Bacillus cereus]|nr:hypothetical protein SAMN05878494_1815 [Bacillus cereus]
MKTVKGFAFYACLKDKYFIWKFKREIQNLKHDFKKRS